MAFFQIFKDGRNVNEQVTYEHFEQARRALQDAPEGAEIVEVDIVGDVIDRMPAREVRKIMQSPSLPKKSKWTRDQRIALYVGLVVITVAIATLIATVTVPELRRYVGLEKPSPTPSPATRSSLPPTQSEHKTDKGEQVKNEVTTKRDVVGNKVSGSGNIIGHHNQANQSAPTAYAPNGIAIAGGVVDHPTVINNGPPPPPPLQLTWTVKDVLPPTRKDFRYQKEITVTPNVAYQPVSLGVTCSAPIGQIFANFADGGAFFSDAEGVDKYNSRVGYVVFESPAVRPDKPLLIDIWSNEPLSVLAVRTATVNGLSH